MPDGCGHDGSECTYLQLPDRSAGALGTRRDMTTREPTPATTTGIDRGRRPALHDVTHLAPPGADAGNAGPTDPTDAPSTIQTSAIQAQVQQVEALLAAVRETVGSLADASVRL